MPNYSGTIVLIVGMAINAAKLFHIDTWLGLEFTDDTAGQISNAVVQGISFVGMAIGIWRLLHTKKVADVAVAQVKAAGIAPVVGPDKGIVPSIDEQVKAAQVVNKEILK